MRWLGGSGREARQDRPLHPPKKERKEKKMPGWVLERDRYDGFEKGWVRGGMILKDGWGWEEFSRRSMMILERWKDVKGVEMERGLWWIWKKGKSSVISP